MNPSLDAPRASAKRTRPINDLYWRYAFLGAVIAVMPVLIAIQVIRIQVDPSQWEKILKESVNWSNRWRTIVPARGQLYDRWGNLLAGNRTVYEVGVELQYVENPTTIAQTVATMLDVDYMDAFAKASLEPSETAVYAVLTDNVPQEKVDQLQALIENMEDTYSRSRGEGAPSLMGLVLTPHLGRIYPEKTLGSNLWGFVSRENQGYFGVEERFSSLLAGKTRTIQEPLDPNLARERLRAAEVPGGASLVLTIDREIQRAMETLIDDAVAESGSQSGTLVVVNPQTGEVLAMATTPRMDLNEFWRYGEIFPKDTPFNRAISQAYEPGSVFKVLTMASALDAGAVEPETVFVDTGQIEYGGTWIYNWNMGAWGPQNMTGCLQHSLNVCLTWVASQVGPNDMYRYLQAFGVGHLTGIDLAGEVTGRLKVPGDTDWYAADLATNSFGQGVAVTPIQMTTAVSAIANGGVMMAPKIVRSVASEGYQHDIESRVIGMPISAETAHTLTDMLARSLEKESSDALIEGYRVAGKTGTAEIPTPFGYTSNATNASFVGWGPVDDPQFLVYVWLEKPQSSPWGSIVAAPVFRRAVEQLVVFLNIPPDDVRHKLLSGN
jgi:cell division protein FtsI/penicillin-binding protein 2